MGPAFFNASAACADKPSATRSASSKLSLCKDRLESRDYFPDYFANKLKAPILGERIVAKPKGLYAVINHRGSYETMSEAYSNIKEYIGSKGMAVCGSAYSVELLNYFAEKNPDDYVIRISVEVCKGRKFLL
ncbi:GyrI-like domain-containing protein [Paenibacillus sp. TY11]|uniref:GyrI-like domain-containing protein n=1 Tax=Paenibacillus sp. TY11 TaxID=3448633 RepID=UPI00403A4527